MDDQRRHQNSLSQLNFRVLNGANPQCTAGLFEGGYLRTKIAGPQISRAALGLDSFRPGDAQLLREYR